MADEHPPWQTALLVIALVLILVLGFWLYWVTSEAHKIRRMQIKLGYQVPTTTMGERKHVSIVPSPASSQLDEPKSARTYSTRVSTDKSHTSSIISQLKPYSCYSGTMFFRTDDYAPLKRRRPPLESFLKDGGPWTDLPRGDSQQHNKLIKAAMAKVRATIIQDTIDEMVAVALTEMVDNRAAERVRALAARWRNNAKPRANVKKEDELNALIASYEAESSSDEDDGLGDASVTSNGWDMGCDVSFIKLAAPKNPMVGPPLRNRHQAPPVSNPPGRSPNIKPMVVGNWGDGGASAADRPERVSKVQPMIVGAWGNGDVKKSGGSGGGGGGGGGGGDGGGGRVKASGAAAGTEGGGGVVIAAASIVPEHPRLGRAESVSRMRGSRPIPLDQLKRIMRGTTPELMRSEFNKLKLNRPPPELLPPACRSLVANVAIFPFPHTRVGVGKDKFINASYIRGADGFPSRYIATQVPVVPGGGGGFADKLPTVGVFWEMVLEHLCPAIVLLDSSGAPFWPVEVGGAWAHEVGGVSVSSRSVTPSAGYTAIVLELQSVNMGTHRVTLFVLDKWDARDDGDLSALIALSNAVRVAAKSNLGAPVVYVDSDGGDRVGTIIAAEHCFEQIRTKEVVDVMRAVSDVREDRGGLVSTPQLYNLVYRLATVFLLGQGVQPQRAHAPPAYTRPPEN